MLFSLFSWYENWKVHQKISLSQVFYFNLMFDVIKLELFTFLKSKHGERAHLPQVFYLWRLFGVALWILDLSLSLLQTSHEVGPTQVI